MNKRLERKDTRQGTGDNCHMKIDDRQEIWTQDNIYKTKANRHKTEDAGQQTQDKKQLTQDH